MYESKGRKPRLNDLIWDRFETPEHEVQTQTTQLNIDPFGSTEEKKKYQFTLNSHHIIKMRSTND